MLGIVVALPVESRTLTRRYGHVGETLRLGPDIHVRIAGMGSGPAVAAAAELHRKGATSLLNWGCAAALSPEVTPGRLLMPASFILPDHTTVHCDPAWWRRLNQPLADLKPAVTPLASTRTILATPQTKRKLHQETGAMAADMESAFLAQWCQEHRIPFVAIRAVSDDANTAVPAVVQGACGRDGTIDLWQLLRQLLRHPGQTAALLRLGRQFQYARDTLVAAADRLLPMKFCLP